MALLCQHSRSSDALIFGLCHYIQLFHFYTACRIRCKQITIFCIYFQLIYLSACLLLFYLYNNFLTITPNKKIPDNYSTLCARRPLLKIISTPLNPSIFPVPVYSLIVSFCTPLLFARMSLLPLFLQSLKKLCRTLSLMAVERLTQFFVRTGEKNSSFLY